LSHHFAFGENWASYAGLIDQGRIEQATTDLRRLVGDLAGRTFIDIGCGSGLHALAAARLGASRILAIDVDERSVETTRALLSRFNVRAQVIVADILNARGLGTFDVVYSWGVLHHTGAMHDAIARAADCVCPDGLFAFALYRKTPWCGFWKVEKRLYSRAPRFGQSALRSLYSTAFAFRQWTLGRSFRAFVDEYSKDRGMDYYHDVHDWLGGYPYESISPEDVNAVLAALGFERIGDPPPALGSGLFGTACVEYVYRRRSSPDGGAVGRVEPDAEPATAPAPRG
jgi:predicted RNA methylase